MELGDDDWNFSQEELDTLERDALRIVAERKSSSATASISSSSQESYFNKVPNLPPSSIRNTQVGVITAKDNAKELQKVCIKLILHSSGKIAAKFTYNELEKLDPLVHRAIVAASAVPDLRGGVIPMFWIKQGRVHNSTLKL
ncbi:hypothetical protein C5167_014312 [Papaver somniferum]|uniref:Uncharacterized protein n=1 Tax=Papaver somniferum TaxID=3469 RepID=A0A4Y7J3R6_PAPSO|nr:hypothetical protein C5167_014312 [Papaver somniferum]